MVARRGVVACAGAPAAMAPATALAASGETCTESSPGGDPLAGMMASYSARGGRGGQGDGRRHPPKSKGPELKLKELIAKAKEVCEKRVSVHGGDKGTYGACRVVPYQPKNVGTCQLQIFVKAGKCSPRPSPNARPLLGPNGVGVLVTPTVGQCSEGLGERRIHEELTVLKSSHGGLQYGVRTLP